jgi:TPR repeat protein
MGVMYHKARGVAENFEKALDYYERAADLGQPNAIYNLGNSFMKGVMNKKRI